MAGPPHLRSIALTLRATAAGALVLLIAWLLRDILLMVFGAVLLACMLRGGANGLHRRTGVGRSWSLLFVIVFLLLVVVVLAWWRGQEIAGQAVQMTDQLTSQAHQLWQLAEQSDWGARLINALRNTDSSALRSLGGYIPGVASSVLGVGGTLVVVIATALFLAASPETYRHGFLRLLPPAWRPRGCEVLLELGETLRLWFLGQLADMAIVTLLCGAGLFVIGVPLAPTLALFAGLLNFVPYIGALAGALPAILVALAQSPVTALWVALLFATVQTLEGNLIAPLIQKRTVSLPPALTLLSQTTLGTLFGVLGLILATPLTAAAMTAVRMIYVESVLEGSDRRAPEKAAY